MAQLEKNLPAMQETWVQFLGQEDTLEKEMAANTLAWRIPWTEESGRLQSIGLQRVGHDSVTTFHFFIGYQNRRLYIGKTWDGGVRMGESKTWNCPWDERRIAKGSMSSLKRTFLRLAFILQWWRSRRKSEEDQLKRMMFLVANDFTVRTSLTSFFPFLFRLWFQLLFSAVLCLLMGIFR